jgi:hypothetical protein
MCFWETCSEQEKAHHRCDQSGIQTDKENAKNHWARFTKTFKYICKEKCRQNPNTEIQGHHSDCFFE